MGSSDEPGMEDDRTTGSVLGVSENDATGPFVLKPQVDTREVETQIVSDLRSDDVRRDTELQRGDELSAEEEEETDAEWRRTSAVEILRRNFGTIPRKSPSHNNNNIYIVQYDTEDREEDEEDRSEDSWTDCSDCEKDNRDTPASRGGTWLEKCRFLNRRLATRAASCLHEVDIDAEPSGFRSDRRTSDEQQRMYCTVYCTADDKYTVVQVHDAEITADHCETPSHSDDANLKEADVDTTGDHRDTGSSHEQPYTLEDLVDPWGLLGLSGRRGGGDRAVLLGCRVCLEDKAIAPLSCCWKAVCDECLKHYVSSQVRVGRADIMCPIPECRGFLEEGVVVSHLANEEVGKYHYFLELSQLDASIKPCPHCSLFTSLKTNNNQRTEHKYKIQCIKCQFVWCFKCHAPWHDGLRCREYRRGDQLLRHWASAVEHGQRNAQKCPRCKIHIQRTEGCDHMTCTQCNTNFCYRCGERYHHLRFFGDHTSNLSIFGCRYRYLPDRPHLRRLVRGSVCVSKVLIAPVVIVLVVVFGALSLVIGVLVFPVYYVCRTRRKQRTQGTGRWI